MDMRKYLKDQASLAQTYADDGAYASAARVLRRTADKLQEHAGKVDAEMARMLARDTPTTRSPLAEEMLAQYRGAPMGVADYTTPGVLPTDALHFSIRRVTLDEDGYSGDGVYWGLPRNTLWHALATVDDAAIVTRWFREPTHAHAVQHVRAEFPKATTQRVS